ncbi:MAG: DUF294 nucleotidyltransferase-like domain-containing protein [Thiohalomonadaceae bacterium]
MNQIVNNQPLTPILEFLRRHAPFDQMAPAHLDYLAKRLKLGFYARGEAVTRPEDGPASRFFIIKQGRIRGELGKDEPDSEGAWELVTGESFPIGALLSRRPVRTINRAVEDTFCFELEREDFDKLFQQSPVFHDFCTRRLANLLDNALRTVQANSATRVSEDTSLSSPLQSLIQRAPISCTADTPVGEALAIMDREHIGSMVVTDAAQAPIGMFTLHDVLSRVALPQRKADTPMREVMSPAPLWLPPEARAYEAALLMAQHGFGHICVVQDGKLAGVVSERDLFSLQRIGLVNLSRSIARAETVEQLAQLGGNIHRLVEQMLAQGASVDQITEIITTLNDSMTQRAIILVLTETGKPTVDFTWMAFGSEGRSEQTLKTDQDNGILFRTPTGKTADEVRAELLPIAKRINDALAVIGFPLCPGNVMASNPECCLSLEEWQNRFSRWIDQGTPQHLLNASIYFDFRSLYGEPAPVEELRAWMLKRVEPNSRFRRQMAENALRNRPPLGLFGDIKVSSGGKHPHSIDLKAQGLTPFVDAARITAIAHGIAATNTVERLRQAAAVKALNPADVEAWAESYHFIQLLRVRVHRRQSEQGQPLSNHVDPDSLNELDRRILKEAFRQARKLQSKLALEYQL